MRMQPTYDEKLNMWVAETNHGREVFAATELECEQATILEDRTDALFAAVENSRGEATK